MDRDDVGEIDDDLLQEFLEDCRKDIRQAHEDLKVIRVKGVRCKNAERLKRFAHQMAGSSALYGFKHVGFEALHLDNVLRGVIQRDEPLPEENIAQIYAMLECIENSLPLK